MTITTAELARIRAAAIGDMLGDSKALDEMGSAVIIFRLFRELKRLEREVDWLARAAEMGGWDAPGADPAKYQEDYVQTGAPAEARHSGFGGERSSGKMSEPCPPDEANDMEHGTTMGGMTLG